LKRSSSSSSIRLRSKSISNKAGVRVSNEPVVFSRKNIKQQQQ
jgi:hypothetical protein